MTAMSEHLFRFLNALVVLQAHIQVREVANGLDLLRGARVAVAGTPISGW